MNECEVFAELYDKGIDILCYFRTNIQQVTLDNNGTVRVCFVENTSLRDAN